MKKIVLNILIILGFITPVGMDAMRQRVDSPGVAWRKLNLLLQDVKNMSEREKEQALSDLSPSLKEDYKEMLAANASRKKDVRIAIIDMMELINQGFIKDARDLDDVIAVVAKANNLTTKEIQDIKLISKKHLEDMLKKGFKKEIATEEYERGEELKKDIVKVGKDEKIVTEGKGEDNPKIADVKLGTEVGGEEKPKQASEEKENLSMFLQDLNRHFKIQLDSNTYPYKVAKNDLYFTRKGTDTLTPLVVKANGFFQQLKQYRGPDTNMWSSSTNDITFVQNAFIKYFFPLIDTLYNKLKDSSDSKDLELLKEIMQKGGVILTYSDIGSKAEKQNKNIILNKTDEYNNFMKQYEDIKERIEKLEE